MHYIVRLEAVITVLTKASVLSGTYFHRDDPSNTHRRGQVVEPSVFAKLLRCSLVRVWVFVSAFQCLTDV